MTADAPRDGEQPVELALFHVGFVVADIHQARNAYGQAFGYRWSPGQNIIMPSHQVIH